MSTTIIRVLFFFVLMLMLTHAYAHKNSTAYLQVDTSLEVPTIKADIALRDIANVIEIDTDFDGLISWGELKDSQSQIFSYFVSRVELNSSTGRCNLQGSDYKLDQHSDGGYVILYLNVICAESATIANMSYTLFFDVDTQHRAMLKMTNLAGQQAYAFSANKTKLDIESSRRDSFVTFPRYIEEGIVHIFAGLDHILFLLSLLLPVVLIRTAGKHGDSWQGVEDYRAMVLDVVRVVTAFTIAHTLTFGLVLIKDISLNVSWVEGLIAFSVIVASVNNLIPVIKTKRWVIGFIFGLIHGLGFASVFVDSGLMAGSTIVALLGFNIGVEIGQIVIVMLMLPVAYLARHGWIYQNLVFRLGSVGIAFVGLFWLVERTVLV